MTAWKSKMWGLNKEESWIILLYIEFLLQDVKICGPMDHSCYNGISAESFACRPSCTSLYADVHFIDENSTASQKRVFKKFKRLTDLYNTYKNQIAFSLDFSPSGSLNQSEWMVKNKFDLFISSISQERDSVGLLRDPLRHIDLWQSWSGYQGKHWSSAWTKRQ